MSLFLCRPLSLFPCRLREPPPPSALSKYTDFFPYFAGFGNVSLNQTAPLICGPLFPTVTFFSTHFASTEAYHFWFCYNVILQLSFMTSRAPSPGRFRRRWHPLVRFPHFYSLRSNHISFAIVDISPLLQAFAFRATFFWIAFSCPSCNDLSSTNAVN